MQASIKIRLYSIISDAMEEALEHGWIKSHDDMEKPDPATIKYNQHNSIMSRLDGILQFEDEYSDEPIRYSLTDSLE